MVFVLEVTEMGSEGNRFIKKQGGYRQYSNEHWEIIDGMDQVRVPSLEEISQRLDSITEKDAGQRYNVYVYKVLPYPPHAVGKRKLLGKFTDVITHQ
jgi:hypothetical protein